MQRMISNIKKFYMYLVRDELDIKRQLINLVLFFISLVQIPTMIFSWFSGISVGLWIQATILIISILVMIDINKHPDSIRPLIMINITINIILFPPMYLLYGGHRTGMLFWMAGGGLAIWILLDGIACYIMSIVDALIIIGVCLFEWNFPQYLQYMNSEKEEFIDQIIALIIIVGSFGFLFKYQRDMYEKQERKLEEQNSKLEEQNAKLENQQEELIEKGNALQEINKNLEAASLAKTDFLASMSHEIRTPINAVLGMDEMILRECEDETILKYAADIDSAGHQLLAIINDILDLSKIESGKMEIHPSEYELYSMANDCFNMINMRARKKDLEFSIENDPSLPSYLVGDEIRIRQIIVNLLTNAVKYTKDGYIKMHMYQKPIDDKHIMLCIDVKDTGVGISDENIDKLFASFERLDEIKNRHVEGTGLGLAITKKFVDLMEGSIRVDSTVDIGSTFTVEIPQEIASNEPMGDFAGRFEKRASAIKSKDSIFTAPTARILVVDDVKMNLNVVRLLLKKTKAQVDMAQSGKECLNLSMLKAYDVILMDHMMPEMDGIETLHKMRKMKMSLNGKTPVIALTANALSGADQMYKKEGFEDYLAKPVKGEELEKILVKYIPNEKVVYTTEEDTV